MGPIYGTIPTCPNTTEKVVGLLYYVYDGHTLVNVVVIDSSGYYPLKNPPNNPLVLMPIKNCLVAGYNIRLEFCINGSGFYEVVNYACTTDPTT